MSKYFVVGKIVNTHGVRGEVRVISTSDFTDERYVVGNALSIQLPNNKEQIHVIVKSHRKHKQFDLLTFEGLKNINDVERFKGGTLKVSEDQLEELDEHEFYYHEIIGCKVLTEDGEELGVIKEILSPGANDVWVVKRPKGKDVYIPYIEDVVKKVDVTNKVVTIHLMEGLIDE